MPIAVFIIFALILQAINLLFTLAIEIYVSKGASVTAFALLYMAMFWIAWKITVWVIDSWRKPAVQVDHQKLVAILFTATQLPLLA